MTTDAPYPASAPTADARGTFEPGVVHDESRARHSPKPLPYGVADYFWDEAARRKDLEIQLYELFQRWGYTLVIPPTFEYADTFYARAGTEFQTEMYRFPDKDGTMLALRPDMTIPVARLVATRLHDSPMPQRYCYLGSVFRYIEPRAGRQREFHQAGVELIGAAQPDADAEVVAVCAAAVEAAQIADYCLVLGQLEYFNGLLHDLSLPSRDTDLLRRAIDRNSEPQLLEFLSTAPLRTQQRRTLEELPELRGADPYAVIARAERHCLNHRMYRALTALRDSCRILEGYGLLDRVYLDLTEIHNLGYYTGLSFEVLAPQTGYTLGSGGRYDNLLASFGHEYPAVGAALGIESLLHARQLQEQTWMQRRRIPSQIRVDTRGDPACLAYIRQWRAHGLRVEVMLDAAPSNPSANQSPHVTAQQTDTARHHASDTNCQIVWTGEGFQVTMLPNTETDEAPNTSYFALDEHARLVAFLTTTFLPDEP